MYQLQETWMGAFYTNPVSTKRKKSPILQKEKLSKIQKQLSKRKSKQEEIKQEIQKLNNDASQDFIQKVHQTMSNFS